MLLVDLRSIGDVTSEAFNGITLVGNILTSPSLDSTYPTSDPLANSSLASYSLDNSGLAKGNRERVMLGDGLRLS